MNIDMVEVTVTDEGTIVTERAYTAEEIAQRDSDIAAAQAATLAEAERQALAASAQQKIAEASGLTPEEMRAIGLAV